MAMEIHENLKKFITGMATLSAGPIIDYNGKIITISSNYIATESFKVFNGILKSYSYGSYYMYMVVGSGERTADKDYILGNIITTVSGYYKERALNGNTVTCKASATNTGAEDITITEIGLFISTGACGFMVAYEHLDSPITVKAGDTFTVNASLTYDLFS